MTDPQDWNARLIAEFRANQGMVGGQFEGAPLLLLTTTGRRSGARRTSPMMYLADGGRWLVFASKAGADTHPAWFLNLEAEPRVSIEVGTETVEAVATPLQGAERERFFAEQARRYPGFAEYQQKTDRVIPVVALERVGPTPG